jgi:hypothetical protein
MIRKHNEEKFSYVVLQKRLKKSAVRQYIVTKQGEKTQDTEIEKQIESLIRKRENGEDFWLTPIHDSRLFGADPTPLNIVQRFLDWKDEDTNPLAESLMEEVDFDDYNPPLVKDEYGRLLR